MLQPHAESKALQEPLAMKRFLKKKKKKDYVNRLGSPTALGEELRVENFFLFAWVRRKITKRCSTLEFISNRSPNGPYNSCPTLELQRKSMNFIPFCFFGLNPLCLAITSNETDMLMGHCGSGQIPIA